MFRMIASTSNKAGLPEFCKRLEARFGGDLMILSTGGTAGKLRENKLTVTDVASFTGSPEVMGGRVKTLHPKIFGGLLARADVPQDLADLENGLRSALISLAVVNLYPFADTAAKIGITFPELIEEIDIGGPSLVRAAAKNFARVTVVVDPRDYSWVADALTSEQGISLEDRFKLAKKAFAHTAEYDANISATLAEYIYDGRGFQRSFSE